MQHSASREIINIKIVVQKSSIILAQLVSWTVNSLKRLKSKLEPPANVSLTKVISRIVTSQRLNFLFLSNHPAIKSNLNGTLTDYFFDKGYRWGPLLPKDWIRFFNPFAIRNTSCFFLNYTNAVLKTCQYLRHYIKIICRNFTS